MEYVSKFLNLPKEQQTREIHFQNLKCPSSVKVCCSIFFKTKLQDFQSVYKKYR